MLRRFCFTRGCGIWCSRPGMLVVAWLIFVLGRTNGRGKRNLVLLMGRWGLVLVLSTLSRLFRV